MRTFKFFQLLVIALVSTMIVSSCDKEDENPLVGTWTASYSDEYGTENYLFTFNSDKTFSGQVSYSETEIYHMSGTYVLDEATSKLYMTTNPTDDIEGGTTTYNISISKKEITLTDPEDSEFTLVFHKK
jgi:lipoprotein